jgi:FkbM family methyltransferase
MHRLPDVTDPPTFWDLLSSQHGVLAFDVGANIGQAANVLAKNFDRVVSFEPCAESLAILTTEAPANVTVAPFALSDEEGKILLTEAANSLPHGMLTTGDHVRWGPVRGQRWVEAIKLDRATARWGIPDLIKIDTEGHELQVLKGAPTTLRARRTKWLIEVHYRQHAEKIFDLLSAYQVRRIEHDILKGTEDGFDHFYIEALP